MIINRFLGNCLKKKKRKRKRKKPKLAVCYFKISRPENYYQPWLLLSSISCGQITCISAHPGGIKLCIHPVLFCAGHDASKTSVVSSLSLQGNANLLTLWDMITCEVYFHLHSNICCAWVKHNLEVGNINYMFL